MFSQLRFDVIRDEREPTTRLSDGSLYILTVASDFINMRGLDRGKSHMPCMLAMISIETYFQGTGASIGVQGHLPNLCMLYPASFSGPIRSKWCPAFLTTRPHEPRE